MSRAIMPPHPSNASSPVSSISHLVLTLISSDASMIQLSQHCNQGLQLICDCTEEETYGTYVKSRAGGCAGADSAVWRGAGRRGRRWGGVLSGAPAARIGHG